MLVTRERSNAELAAWDRQHKQRIGRGGEDERDLSAEVRDEAAGDAVGPWLSGEELDKRRDKGVDGLVGTWARSVTMAVEERKTDLSVGR